MYGWRNSRTELSMVKRQLRRYMIFFDSSVPHFRRSGRLQWCGRTAKKKAGSSRTFQTFPAKGKCFSKLRSSIAGLYVWRAEHARDADAKSQSQNAADLALRQAYALCPYSPEALFRYTKLLIDLNRPDEAVLVAKTSLRFDPDNASFQALVRSLRRSE